MKWLAPVLLCGAAVLPLAHATCPYTKLWLKHGPKRATEILSEQYGIDMEPSMSPARHKRMLLEAQGPAVGFGMCEYANPFAGSDDCIQLIGAGWDADSSSAMCAKAMGGMAQGTLTPGGMCPQSADENLAGYCYTKQDTPEEQAQPMVIAPGLMGSCEQVASACETFAQGTFRFAGACSGSTSGVAAPSEKKPGEPIKRCTIAPGPMGGAHQHAKSPGYDVDCADAPGKNSVYQWPLRWQADFEMQYLPVHPDPNETPFSSNGTVYYDFTNNWKRQDSVNEGLITFTTEAMADAKNITILHRGDLMVFINHYENNTKSCRRLNLGIIGNVRPDWFMDSRGMASNSQYLGNQHIFHRGQPTLVKQWRKSDFADMYFVMSILEKPGEDGVHWPVQRNDPGEGFGHDALHSYFNHKILSEADRDIWFPDEGMDCVDLDTEGQTEGPPVAALNGEEYPSHLNIKEAGWFELQYTASPDGPTLEEAMAEATKCASSASSTLAAPAQAASAVPAYELDLGGAGVVQVCRGEQQDVLEIQATFVTPGESWVALGFRPDDAKDLCAMTPAATLIVEKEEDWIASYGDLQPALHVFSPSEGQLQMQYDQLEVLAEGWAGDRVSDMVVARDNGRTTLSFNAALTDANKEIGSIPMIFAVGKTPTLDYHAVRGCVRVQLSAVPSCADVGTPQMTGHPDVALAINALRGATDKKLDEGFEAMQEAMGTILSEMNKLHSSVRGLKPCSDLDKEQCIEEEDRCRWSRVRTICRDAAPDSPSKETRRRSSEP